MEYKYLTNTPIEKVQQCMQESFSDYQIDMSYMTVKVMKHRNAICRNHPETSVGAFDGDKMVGFLNVGVDYFNNELVAFDGGTGVIKKYRGQGVAGNLFTKAVEALNQKGIHKFILEVLQLNTSAIRAYEKEGFTVSRIFKCYDISIEDYKGITNNISGVSIHPISVIELEEYWHFIKYPESWEHMLSGLKEVKDDILINAAFQKNECIGFNVYNPILCWITAIGVHPDYENDSLLVDYLILNLFQDIDPSKPKISMNNLMEKDRLNIILTKLGFDNVIDQYEMIAEI